jgi:hypothetical protein
MNGVPREFQSGSWTQARLPVSILLPVGLTSFPCSIQNRVAALPLYFPMSF